MNIVQETIQRLVNSKHIPIAGKFEITEDLLKAYYSTYASIYGNTGSTGSRSNIKYARRLAGLNLLKENIYRGVSAGAIKAGHVYLIGNPAFVDHYKIGVTYDVHKRLAQYQTCSPFRDFFLKKYDFVCDKALVEKLLLNHPLIQRAQGEWVLKENAVTVYDDLAKSHLADYY